jgi:hypothetical protein
MRVHLVNPSDLSFGTAVITPQSGGGLSADDRRALAEQMADDERRGLSE